MFPGFHAYVNTVFRLDALLFCGFIAAVYQAVSGLLHGIFLDGAVPSIGTLSGMMLTVLALIISTVLALVSYRYFETRFIQYGRSVRYE